MQSSELNLRSAGGSFINGSCSFGGIDYLRISVTDRCNFRCVYCMPPEGVALMPREELLSFEEIWRITRILASAGILKVKLTGGEPLVRLHLPRLVSMIASIPQIRDLSMTTNGSLLSKYASQLKKAGLQRVNISLDSLRSEKFAQVTRGGRLENTLRGIEAALKIGLVPVKLNILLIRGFNEDEIPDFIEFARQKPVSLKFIEFMPTQAQEYWNSGGSLLKSKVMGELEKRGAVRATGTVGPGPARYYRVEGLEGLVGIVSALSQPFCDSCNRLRLTADGRIKSCLYTNHEVDLKPLLRSDGSDAEILAQVREVLFSKPRGGNVISKFHSLPQWRSMAQIGG